MFRYFTRRHGLDRPAYDLKYEYIPPAFRSDLYKLLKESTDTTVQLYCIYRDASVVVNRDSVRYYTADAIEEYFNPDLLIELLLDAEWHEVLSIAEFAARETGASAAQINELLEYHRVGYRLETKGISGEFEAVVHYETLVSEAETLLEKEIEYEGVLACVETARRVLADPRESVEPAVKASVDAVEGYLKGWLAAKGHRVATLGDCIKILGKQELAPKRIISSLEQLYIFRNSEPNVGHGAPDRGELSRDDALLCFDMAISFVNYFHRKALKQE